MRSSWFFVIGTAAALAACGGHPVDVSGDGLVGTWSLSENPQVWGVISGSMTFRDDGTFIVIGHVPAASGFIERRIEGAWESGNATVKLVLADVASTWQTERADDQLRFLELAGTPRSFSIFKPGPD